jgi:hypothetical protein
MKEGGRIDYYKKNLKVIERYTLIAIWWRDTRGAFGLITHGYTPQKESSLPCAADS